VASKTRNISLPPELDRSIRERIRSGLYGNASDVIRAGLRQRIPEVLAAQRPEVEPRPVLDWLLAHALFVDPLLLGKPRSRDLKDDRYLACALGGKAEALVTNNRDLVDLGKPFWRSHPHASGIPQARARPGRVLRVDIGFMKAFEDQAVAVRSF
jgi:hypothetical protein